MLEVSGRVKIATLPPKVAPSSGTAFERSADWLTSSSYVGDVCPCALRGRKANAAARPTTSAYSLRPCLCVGAIFTRVPLSFVASWLVAHVECAVKDDGAAGNQVERRSDRVGS